MGFNKHVQGQACGTLHNCVEDSGALAKMRAAGCVRLSGMLWRPQMRVGISRNVVQSSWRSSRFSDFEVCKRVGSHFACHNPKQSAQLLNEGTLWPSKGLSSCPPAVSITRRLCQTSEHHMSLQPRRWKCQLLPSSVFRNTCSSSRQGGGCRQPGPRNLGLGTPESRTGLPFHTQRSICSRSGLAAACLL